MQQPLATELPCTRGSSRSDVARTFTCEVVTDFARLEELSPEWQRLWNANPRAEVFQKFAWARAFWKAYGAGLSLCCPTVYKSGQLIGILPLAGREGVLSFLGTPGTDYNDLLCEEDNAAPNVLAAAISAMLEARFKWHTISLKNLPEHSRVVRSWDKLPASLRRHLQLTRLCPCPAILLSENRTETLRALLKKKSLSYYQRQLEKQGIVRFRHIESREEIHEHLENFFEQHIQRHAMNGDRSQFLSTVSRSFYRALVEELDPRTELRFGVIELDGRPLAYHFGFESNGKFILYKPTFDVDHWEQSPGQVLLRKLLEYVKDEPLTEFDFTTGDETYKLRFANYLRYNFGLYIDRRPASIRSRCSQLQRSARERLKVHPRALEFARKTATTLRAVRTSLQRRSVPELLWGWLSGALRWIGNFEHVLLFTLPPCADTAPEAEIKRGTLAELAGMSIGHPDWFTPAKLRSFRERFKSGDQALFLCHGNTVAYLAWSGFRNQYGFEGQRPLVPLDPPGTLIYDVSSVPEVASRSIHVTSLRALRHQANGQNIWVACRQDKNTKNELRQAGFRQHRHLCQLTLLGRFRCTWISELEP